VSATLRKSSVCSAGCAIRAPHGPVPFASRYARVQRGSTWP